MWLKREQKGNNQPHVANKNLNRTIIRSLRIFTVGNENIVKLLGNNIRGHCMGKIYAKIGVIFNKIEDTRALFHASFCLLCVVLCHAGLKTDKAVILD